ncbi:uncharacterized protein B4U79_11285 [Dinothrombium tinctorium]|uniref:G-protein coupled receptors family 2 profile 2 domain-containing protein n=1 Tax=Dinothrombium tinctorium TaxID=1965070 RepID=A0A3S3NWL8_9ACAR|nr:uncharacterized protein B4U79_11285 [Dinothrombium tinctorium]
MTVQMISKCPRSWSSKSIEQKCVNQVSVKKDPFLSIPVFSRLTELTYKNLYCAVCNDDADFSEPWIVYSRCKKRDKNGDCSSSRLFFEPPHLNGTLRECIKSDMYSCPNNSEFKVHREISSKCDIYASHLVTEDGLVVKNEYCAKCNNISLDTSNCLKQEKLKSETNEVHNSKFSLAIIIDIDFLNGGTVVGTKERCARNYVYDPWKKFCRLVTCDKDSRLEDDKCIPLHGIKNQVSIERCPKLTFDSTEYSLLDDGKAFIKSRNKTLRMHEYTININTGRLSICAYINHIQLETKFSDFESHLSILGISVSILSLLTKILLFFLKPEPRKVSNILVLFLSISLLIAQTMFLVAANHTDLPLFCKSVGILMHYFFLCSFFWMNVLSSDIYRTFNTFLHSFEKKPIITQIIQYSVYGWVIPAIIVCTALINEIYDTKIAPKYGVVHCWISNRFALLVFFAIPMAILLIVNTGTRKVSNAFSNLLFDRLFSANGNTNKSSYERDKNREGEFKEEGKMEIHTLYKACTYNGNDMEFRFHCSICKQ